MTWQSYEEFFKCATGHIPFNYQIRLATADPLPSLLSAPTGAGKTDATILAWLWRRRGHADPRIRDATPRRLVYCLPMRVLVEQTRSRAVGALSKLDLLAERAGDIDRVALHVMMGGHADLEWTLHPEQDAIIVGTQDMLLSAALNRAFGVSRFRWSVLFGLLNNDCLWVMDEIQLMGSGLATSLQLEAFRRSMGHWGEVQTLWMSATSSPRWLATVDHPAPAVERVMTLNDDDRRGALAKRLNAVKILSKHRLSVPREKGQARSYAVALAEAVRDAHVPGTLTLVVVNTVERAVAVQKALAKQTADPRPAPEILLLHSRFRAFERRAVEEKLRESVDTEGPGRIIVATQVVEAGVDLSAKTLFTELARWPSLVQRLGRLNRSGEFVESRAYWVDVPDEAAAPYSAAELRAARAELLALEGKSVGPASLPVVEMPYEAEHILRRRDVTGLFDTAPDISGGQIDVSRFVRDVVDIDVHVYWRTWPDSAVPRDVGLPHKDEVCSVPVWAVRKYAEKRPVWSWDHLDGVWSRARPAEIMPGQILLLRADHGGYDPQIGWDPTVRAPVPVVPVGGADSAAEDTTDDSMSFGSSVWLTIAQHTDHVVQQMEALLKALSPIELPPDAVTSLRLAARWHDAGKSHPVFQETMLRELPQDERQNRDSSLWAKRPGRSLRHRRPHFRHEVASALCVLTRRRDELASYLVLSHHGKVRMSLRVLPKEVRPPDPTSCHALGTWDGDRLPECDLGGGVTLPSTTLALDVMRMGRSRSDERAWTERVLRLRDSPDLGPFRLAFLEALLVAADRRASALHQGGR